MEWITQIQFAVQLLNANFYNRGSIERAIQYACKPSTSSAIVCKTYTYKKGRVMASTITFRPTEEQGGFIDGIIESGDFANQSEVIRAGIRLLQEQRVESKLTQLRQLIREGECGCIFDSTSVIAILKIC